MKPLTTSEAGASVEPLSTAQEKSPDAGSRPFKGRRTFLGRAGAAIAAALGLTATGAEAQQIQSVGDEPKFALGGEPDDLASNRYTKAYKCRVEAAKMARNRPLVHQLTNGDEERYLNKIGSYTKALPHNQLGEVDLAAY